MENTSTNGTPAKTSWRPYIVLAIGLLAVSSSSIMTRFAQSDGASSLLISAWRVAVATIVLTPIVLTKYRKELRGLDRKTLALALVSGLFLAIHFAAWITSLEYTSVLSSVVLVNTNPLWVILATPFFLHERVNPVTMVAVLVAVVGGLFVSASGGAGTAIHQNAPLLGNGLAIVGALGVAVYYLIGRRLRATVSLIPYIWLTYGFATLVLIVVVFLTGQPITGLKSDAYFWMTWIGLIPQLIGHSSLNYALGYLSAAYVSLTILAEPIGSTILAIFLLREYPAGVQLRGGILILAALILASRAEFQMARAVEQEAPVG